jgi:hypothetical protein
MMQITSSIVEELTFLRQYANEDEATILTRALHLGLNQLYREAVEQAFIDEQLSREKAMAILGQERIEEIEYAKQALAEDVARGLDL